MWSLPPATLSANVLISMMSKDPAVQNRMDIPISSPMSPTRLVRNAFSAASELGFSSHQWPISTKEQRPTNSQAVMNCTVLLLMTRRSIEAENSDRKAK